MYNAACTVKETKIMPKTDTKSLRNLRDQYGRSVLIFGVAAIFAVTSATVPRLSVEADSYDARIRALQNQNNANRAQVRDLKAQATSYEDAIHQFEIQIASLQAAINENQAKQEELGKQIAEHEEELLKQRNVLGKNIKAMYVESNMTTIEMLATSKDLSEYVDKETYRNAVQSKIQTTMAKIKKLQAELNAKKAEVEELLAQQQAQQNDLNNKRAEQTALLNMNQQQQADFQKKIKETQAQIASLQAQQAAENARLFGNNVPGIPGGGGYQWGDASCLHIGVPDPPCGEYDWGYRHAASPRNLYDPWGYGYRNCTSWTAFRLNQQGYRSFSYLGNAKLWPSRVPSSWVSYGKGAQVGDAAVSTAGNYGHVMYVEAVNGDGTVTISDYNRSGDGLYRTGTRSQSGLYFISFPR